MGRAERTGKRGGKRERRNTQKSLKPTWKCNAGRLKERGKLIDPSKLEKKNTLGRCCGKERTSEEQGAAAVGKTKGARGSDDLYLGAIRAGNQRQSTQKQSALILSMMGKELKNGVQKKEIRHTNLDKREMRGAYCVLSLGKIRALKCAEGKGGKKGPPGGRSSGNPAPDGEKKKSSCKFQPRVKFRKKEAGGIKSGVV